MTKGSGKELQIGGLTGEEVEAMRKKIRAASYTKGGANVRKLFTLVDRDKGGTLSLEEFTRAIRRGKITPKLISDRDLKALFKAIDADGNGTLDVEEFVEFVGERALFV